MATGIQISSSSGITIGTTAIDSGVDTRVLFQQGGVVQQDANFTFNNTQKRLTLRASGTAATDIPFAIRNSADTDNLAYISGNGLAIIGINASSSPTLIIDPSGSARATLRGGTNQSILLNSSGFNNLNGGSGGWDIEATGGQIRQRNGSNYTLLSGNFFGIGRTPSARLDVQAQGALSTDIALRVRNSADTANLFDVQGDGRVNVISRVHCGFQGMTTTGGALHVFAGNSADTVARFYNTTGSEIMGLRTSGNGGVLSINDASGNAGVIINGIFSNALTFGAGRDIWFDTATGTKIGAATNQRFAFWNKTPIVQPTTAIAAATFVANTSGIVNDTATFDGYTIGQVVKALRDVGLLA
jgi:hypothetical protein